jgi:SAM-dependent methyltransferase
MLRFYPRQEPRLILDATVNVGRFWRGSPRKVIGLDIQRRFRPTIVGDNRRMPFKDAVFDVVVYDPPHVPNQGQEGTKDFKDRFGVDIRSGPENGYNLSHLYGPFLAEAYRVLRPEGILLAKIADYVHNHRYHWAHVEFINRAAALGFCACDCVIKVRRGPIIDPKWKEAHHSRRHHVYWIVLRKSNRCE